MSKKDPNKKGFFGEFKEFITRGNVIDMAVGVIIGGAFTAIVTALTSGILTPLINFLIGLIFLNALLTKRAWFRKNFQSLMMKLACM